MRFLIFTVGALLLALVAALFAAPLIIDPDDYRQQIVSQLRSATGAEFDIRGKMAFSVLPTPRLHARDLRLVTNIARAEDLLRVDAMRADLSVGDLLAGQIVVDELVLIRPTLSLTVNHAGQANWENWNGRAATSSPADEPVLIQAVSVSDGVIYYRDTRSDIDRQMSQVHLEISETGPGGPQRIRGSGVLEKLTTNWDIRVGHGSSAGKWPLSGRISTADGTIVQTQGNYASPRRNKGSDASVGAIAGKIEVSNPEFGSFLSDLRKLGISLPEVEVLQDQKLEITANMTLGRDRMDVRDIEIQAQELKARASVSANWAQPVSTASASLHIERLDLDRLLVGEAQDTSGIWARLFRDASPPLVPANTNIDGEVRIDLLKLGGRVSRQMVLAGQITKGIADIRNLSALVPGGGRVSIRGEYQTPAGSPRFNGSMEAKTGNLRSLARMIRPGERAMALAVDEIIGAGGQLSPGDYVDVLLYLPPDQLNTDRSAQTVVPALRVLSVGALMGPVNQGQDDQGQRHEDRAQQQQLRASARSVVVAVPDKLLSRLMLASQAGPLRLTVRSAEEKNLQRYWAGDSDIATQLDTAGRNVVHYEQLNLGGKARATPVGDGAVRKPKGIEVIRGNQITQQTP